ncbi:MAG: NAD(P)H-hydrate dehydratase [Enhydrobacter sp.]|nr:NAD(P)H-hydrate dehydratase [Enhydrobacter sp.]
MADELTPTPEFALLTCAEMAAADAAAIASGIPGSTLMEAAGRAVARAVNERYRRQPVVVLCGPGNNGGDGFVAARHLQAEGWPVKLALLRGAGDLRGDAARAARQWKGPVAEPSPGLLDGRPLVIDALFGAGLARPIDGDALLLIEAIERAQLSVVAVDVPSGLHGDTGEILGAAPHAELTVTFFRSKPGHYSLEGLRRCGELKVVDIGIPASVLDAIGPRLWRNEPVLWADALRRDDPGNHKYARGHLTILGGAEATGAARLAAMAGRRAGAGLATIASPSAATAIYRMAEPGNLIVDADDGASFRQLLADKRRNGFLIGPGSGVNERTREAVLAVLAAGRAVVLDADAVTTFSDDRADLFSSIGGPALLTPHEGEFRRLFPDLDTVPGKVARVRQAARLSGATVLLKGPDTVIAAPDGRAVINVHAPTSLATAGSGDVLAGLAAGLMTRGLAPLPAAAAAAWLHGECAYRFGKPGLIAEDLAVRLPEALAAAMN